MKVKKEVSRVCPACGWVGKKLGTHVSTWHIEMTPKQFYDKYLFGKLEGHRTDRDCKHPNCNNEVSFDKISSGYRDFCCNSCANSVITKKRFENIDKETYDAWIKKKSDAQKRIWANMPDEERKRRGDNHSEHLTQMILDGEFAAIPTYTHIKHGWHESGMAIGGKVYYRSSWELEAFKFLDLFPNIVDCYYTCPITIPYEFYGKSKNYIPDIFINYIDGTKKLVEIKPSPYLSDEKVQAKIIAGDIWCKDNDLKFSVWTEKTFPFYGV